MSRASPRAPSEDRWGDHQLRIPLLLAEPSSSTSDVQRWSPPHLWRPSVHRQHSVGLVHTQRLVPRPVLCGYWRVWSLLHSSGHRETAGGVPETGPDGQVAGETPSATSPSGESIKTSSSRSPCMRRHSGCWWGSYSCHGPTPCISTATWVDGRCAWSSRGSSSECCSGWRWGPLNTRTSRKSLKV